MTKHIGRRISVGIGKETTRGTVAAAAYWLAMTGINHEGKVENAYCNAAQGTIVDSNDAEIVKEWAEGGFDALIGSKHFGLILYSLLGTVSSTTAGGETIVFDHTFTLAETAQHQSLTLSVDQPNGDKQYALATMASLSLAFEKGKILDYSVNMMSKKGATATLTPAFTTETKFRPQDFTFKLAATLATLGAAPAIEVKSVNLEFSKELESDDVLGDTEPVDFLNRELMISGDVTLTYDNQTYEDLMLNGTHRAMRITIQNTGVTIGNASNPTIQIDLAKCVFEEVSFDRGLGDIVKHTLKFKAVYSNSDSKVGEIVLTNLEASY